MEYWVRGELLGTREVPAVAEFWDMMGKFFMCNVCQEVWGWIYYPNRHWCPIHYDCPDHNSQRYEQNIPGSMLPAYPGGDEIDLLPDRVLEYEFHMHLAYIDKEQSHGKEGQSQAQTEDALQTPETLPSQERADEGQTGRGSADSELSAVVSNTAP